MAQAVEFEEMAPTRRHKEPIFRSSSLQMDHPMKKVSSFSGHFDTRKGTREEEDGEGEVELSLGLSLHGRFGVDPIKNKGKEKLLVRSASIPEFLNPDRGSGMVVSPPPVRTCSLPLETEEEWRKRKEAQTLRRMEAKRKRSEKQHHQQQRILKASCGGRSRSLREEGGLSEQGNGGLLEGVSQPVEVVGVPSSRGSIGSQGSGSSVLSESESLHAQGINKKARSRSPISVQMPVAVTRPGSPEGGAVENGRHDEPMPTENGASNMARALRNALEEMPRVSTKGLGVHGKQLEGLLYGYRKGEETRILCVCHGNFFTPSEFVKHAGGDNIAVAQPLKHIVVDVSPLL